MEGMIFLLLLSAGAVVFATLAGEASKRKVLFGWSLAAVVWSAVAIGAVLCRKDAVRKILFDTSPSLEKMRGLGLEKIFIPDRVIFQVSPLPFIAGIAVFLFALACRRNAVKRVDALFWTAGLLALAGGLSLPLFCGIAAWINICGFGEEDFFNPFASHLPALYATLLTFAAAGGLWCRHTRKAARHSRRNILIFAGIATVCTALLWLSALGAGIGGVRALHARAEELKIAPCRTGDALPPDLRVLQDKIDGFYRSHRKYQPPFSGTFDWRTGKIPADVREYTLKMFDAPKHLDHLDTLKKLASGLSKKDVLYLAQTQAFRALVRNHCDRAALFALTGQREKILPELMKYPELEALIAPDTPFLLTELVRAATHIMWISILVPYGPDDPRYLPVYRKLLAWSKSRQVRLPSEAGRYLHADAPPRMTPAAFFYRPCRDTARYRGFFTLVEKRPLLEKLERQEVITGKGAFANAARRQREAIVMGRTAIALKAYRAEHGRYPENLAVLIPSYLEKIPLSPFPGEKLVYTSTGNGFTLSSRKRLVLSTQRATHDEKISGPPSAVPASEVKNR